MFHCLNGPIDEHKGKSDASCGGEVGCLYCAYGRPASIQQVVLSELPLFLRTLIKLGFKIITLLKIFFLFS